MGEEKLYIGSKLIRALPMSRNQFQEDQGKETRVEPDESGYVVKYPDDYISWSPKKVFENAYREVTDSEKALC